MATYCNCCCHDSAPQPPAPPRSEGLLEALRALKGGDFDVRLTGAEDELSRAFNEVAELAGVLVKQFSVFREEVGVQGDFSLRLTPEVPVRGGWRSLVDSVNSLVADLAQPTSDVMPIIDAVSQGNLGKRMPSLVDGLTIPQGEYLRVRLVVNSMMDRLCSVTSELQGVIQDCGVARDKQDDETGDVWKGLTDDANAMADALAVQMRAMTEVMDAVARGDLSVRVSVPVGGEVLGLKQNIEAVIDQLHELASEATEAAGPLERIEDAGVWQRLRRTVAVIPDLAGEVQAVTAVATAVAKGDVSKRITVSVSTQASELKDSINSMVDQLNAVATEVSRVALEVGCQGILGGQARIEGVQGLWKELKDNVNTMALNLTSQVRTIADLASAVTEGDLSRTISVATEGEMTVLKDTLNTMIRSLERASVGHRKEEMQGADTRDPINTQFMANLSHEIRTPLNCIIGMTDLMLDTMNLSETHRSHLSTMLSAEEGLLTIINDTLDFTKMDAGKVRLSEAEFSLRRVLGDAMRALAIGAHTKGLELVCDIAAEVPDPLVGDPNKLQQVLTNLISNSIKFTAAGEVVVRVTSDRTDDVNLIHFSVTDTGIGIPEEMQRIIFDPYVQADDSNTRRYGGTGLGLTISASLVALMGGELCVKSFPGEGSEFYFTLRLERGSGIDPERFPAWPKDLSVLIVDDNDSNVHMLEGLLGEHSTHTCSALQKDRALELLASCKHLAIILGQTVEGIDELCEYIQRSLHQCPVIMVTTISALKQQGCPFVYVTKPIFRAALLAAILRALEQQHQGTPEPPQELAPATPDVDRGPADVLLVEDNSVSQMVATRLLENLGHRVTLAEDGLQAVRLACDRSFDLVLMDLQMPVMGGRDATARIREFELESDRHTPIVAMTACALTGARELCLQVGMDGYLSKPIRLLQLRETINKFVIGGGY